MLALGSWVSEIRGARPKTKNQEPIPVALRGTPCFELFGHGHGGARYPNTIFHPIAKMITSAKTWLTYAAQMLRYRR